MLADLFDGCQDSCQDALLVAIANGPLGTRVYAQVAVNGPGENLRAAEVDTDDAHVAHRSTICGRLRPHRGR
jgi:hypothetical protein